jgi:hypothetical protein
MAATEDRCTDQELLDRCQSQDNRILQHAWVQLFREHDSALARGVRAALRWAGHDPEKVDDFVQHVRYTLGCHPNLLAVYEPSRASLHTYLASLAWHIARHEWGKRQSKPHPQYVDPDRLPEPLATAECDPGLLEDLRTVLTPGQREIVDALYTADESEVPNPVCSAEEYWNWKHRSLKRWVRWWRKEEGR